MTFGGVKHGDKFMYPENCARLVVLRYRSRDDETLSLCHDSTDGKMKFLCYGLEDEFRTVKVWGETRIPAGVYEFALRCAGKHHERYSEKFASLHEGMLWLRNPSAKDLEVPNFKWVLWHIGNDDDDTAACYLTGSAPTEQGTITSSTKAYKRVYAHIVAYLKAGRRTFVEYIDYDTVG